ncbi:MAG: mechanosensitive ion channel family protein [Opitutales bacterium]
MTREAYLPDLLFRYIRGLGIDFELATFIVNVTGLVGLILILFLIHRVTHWIVGRYVRKLIAKTSTSWDDHAYDFNLVSRAAHLVPVVAVPYLVRQLIGRNEQIQEFVRVGVQVYGTVVIIGVISAALNLAHAILSERNLSRRIPLRGFFQAVKLVVFLFGAVVVFSTLIGTSPLVFLSGLGALSAVLLLVFRDPILGFAAGIILSANNMVKVGDWIEMQSAGADGDVIDVTLTTVKVRNWDKTITTIPAYDLISRSFKNWQGMKDTGGRRIKRTINIDLNTIRFLDDEVIKRFRGYRFLTAYLDAKAQEIDTHNQLLGEDANRHVDGRTLTNIGTFRAYCVAYLKNHPQLRQDMTQLVRQRQPTGQGLPLEIYAFTNTTVWGEYEGIQSDIFDHLLAVLPEFDLRAFQEPSGDDVRALRQINAGPG